METRVCVLGRNIGALGDKIHLMETKNSTTGAKVRSMETKKLIQLERNWSP